MRPCNSLELVPAIRLLTAADKLHRIRVLAADIGDAGETALPAPASGNSSAEYVIRLSAKGTLFQERLLESPPEPAIRRFQSNLTTGSACGEKSSRRQDEPDFSEQDPLLQVRQAASRSVLSRLRRAVPAARRRLYREKQGAPLPAARRRRPSFPPRDAWASWYGCAFMRQFSINSFHPKFGLLREAQSQGRGARARHRTARMIPRRLRPKVWDVNSTSLPVS